MKIDIRTEQVIDIFDWDRLVEDTYDKPYRFQQQNGCRERGRFEFTVPEETEDFKNDTVPEIVNGEEMGVSFNAWLAKDVNDWHPIDPADKMFSKLWWHRNFYPNIHMVANDLHAKGLLPAGNYVIDIDW